MEKIDFKLYLITDRNLIPANSLVERIQILVQCGVKAVQLREKDLSAREIVNIAKQIQKFPTKLFINDRADIVYSLHVSGLHIPEQGFPAQEARKIIGDQIIGKSAHSLETALRAEREGADFITFGPIYDTPSKRQYGIPLGIKNLREITKQISIPAFAIGGINPQRAKECLDAGAYGVAVISDLLCAADPKPQVAKYQQSLGSL
jgi:thiamine-phosphate pyrophosphorylase